MRNENKLLDTNNQVPSQSFMTTIILKDIDQMIKNKSDMKLKEFYLNQKKQSNLFIGNKGFPPVGKQIFKNQLKIKSFISF